MTTANEASDMALHTLARNVEVNRVSKSIESDALAFGFRNAAQTASDKFPRNAKDEGDSSDPFVQNPSASVATCLACSKEFKAWNPQEARSNLQRHLRTSPRHNINKCPLSECRVRPSMRSDNLDPHLKKIHKMLSSSKRQVIINENKLLTRRIDRDGIARRISRLE